MSLKTIIAMLVLGSSSVAVAQPMVRDHRSSYSFSGAYQAPALSAQVRFDTHVHSDSCEHAPARPSYGPTYAFDRGRGFDRSDGYGHGRFRVRPLLLAPASQMSLSNDGQAYSRIDSRLAVTALEINGLGGVQDVDSIVLQLSDGSSQTIHVQRHLSERAPIIRIQLARRGLSLDGVYINGHSASRTALQVTGFVR